MPYTCKGNDVIRSDTGALVKHHPTHAAALAHLRALKANVEAQEAEFRKLDEHAREWLPEVDSSAYPRPFLGIRQAAPTRPEPASAEPHLTALAESEKTAGYSVTKSPFSASTTSNWIARVGGLPAYVQNVAKGIMKTGKSESQAIASAIAVMKRWAAGGGGVHPEVRAAAAKALAEWEAKRAASHAKAASS
jgi:hypothetical protein